jgi:hypothetical protein
MAYTDAELLTIVQDEKRRSIGFDANTGTSSELTADRERALNYIKGEMTDVPSLPNRSSAVSTDVADTIETWLSDMVEVLAGGEDVVTFQPSGEADEQQARQETDYVSHVFFNENAGFMTLYTMLKDAGQTKTGVVTWWEDDVPAPEPTQFAGQTEAQVGMIYLTDEVKSGAYTIEDVQPSQQVGPQGEQLFDLTVVPKPRKRVRVAAVSPSDFSVAADTVALRDTTYCAMRNRPRAQDLLAEGVDPDIVDRLPPYSSNNNTEQQARDTAGEHSSGVSEGGVGDLRQVEVFKHYIRLVQPPENVPKIWCLRTSNDDAVLIDKTEVDEVPFAAITPYPVTHRFYGESIADKTMEPQKIRTSLTRIALDSAYFALNQRNEVSENDSSENTIPDLLRNEPGMPVRSKTGHAVTSIQAGSLSFDPFNALEYFATVIEARTGVVRNAQGLNPDTLHDTASGASMMATAAQKRIALMARIFAETGIKDMYLGIHAMLRRIGGMTDTIRLRGSWVDVDPTGWGQRNDMTVEVGVGSSGRQRDLQAMNLVIDQQAKVVEMQGGATGPLVTLKNLYASAIRVTQKAGLKTPEDFWTDPEQAEQEPKPPTPPSPEQQQAAAEAQQDQANTAAQLQLDQGKLQLDQQKVQGETQVHVARLQLEQRKIELDEAKLELEKMERDRAHQLAATKMGMEFQERSEKLAMEASHGSAKLALEAQHGQAKLDTEAALRTAEINAQYGTALTVAQIRSAAEQMRAGTDLTLQANAHEHEHAMADHEHGHDVAVTVLGAALQPQAEEADPPEADEPDEDDK